MDARWLLTRLKNPSLLEKGDERILRELIASFPYFSAPYLVLAKSLKDQNHPAFDDLLPLISLQAYDRKRLFKLVNEPFGSAHDDDVEVLDSGHQLPEVIDQAQEEELEPVSSVAHRFAVDFSEVEKAEEEVKSDEHQEMEEIPFLVSSLKEGEMPNDDHFDSVRDDEPFDSAKSLDQDDDFEKAVYLDQNPAFRIETPEKNREAIFDSNQKQTPEPVTADPEPLPERVDFLHWLDKLAPISKESGVFEIEAETPDTRHQMPDTRGQIPEVRDQVPEELISQVEVPEPEIESVVLIDKFIETNPSVSRVKERMYDPVVQAKESERLDDTLITETMARIFAKQEKFERAIDAYMKLQLKYPQKSDYFAALIEEINRKRS